MGLFTGLTRFAGFTGLSIMRRFAVGAPALNTGDTGAGARARARAGAPTVADHHAAGFNKLKTKNTNKNHENPLIGQIMVRTDKNY
jgi:hypothetical protein